MGGLGVKVQHFPLTLLVVLTTLTLPCERDDEVQSLTGQPFLSDIIRRRRLSFFRHLSRADPSQDHSRVLQSCILGLPRDWCHRVGRPRQSWPRTVEDDLRPLNVGLAARSGQIGMAATRSMLLRKRELEEQLLNLPPPPRE